MCVSLLGIPLTASSVAAAGTTSGTEASHWSSAGRVAPRGGLIVSVSCPDLGHCTSVDDDGDARVFRAGRWRHLRSADHDLGPLASVSCPTDAFCAAVGGRREVVETNGTWGRVHVAPADLTSVTCWAPARCRAAGAAGVTMRYDGSWRRGPDAGTTDLDAISCSARDSCVAVDAGGSAYRLHQGRWQSLGPVFTGYGVRAINLSCASRHLCMAATNGARVSRWNGRTWSQHKFRHLGTALKDGSVSCPTRAYCAWVSDGGSFASWRGHWGRASRHPRAVDNNDTSPPFDCAAPGRCLEVGDHTTVIRHGFHRHPTPPPSFAVPYVSCPTAGTCVSVNGAVAGRVYHRGRWSALLARPSVGGPIDCTTPSFCAGPGATWDGSSWSLAKGFPYADVWSIDCVTSSYCLAAGLYDDGDNPDEVWNGTSWSAIQSGPEAVSAACAAVSDCWTLTSEGIASHWDGTSWSPGEPIFHTFDGAGLACPASGFCLAWNHSGEVVYLREGAWGGGEQVAPMEHVGCASATFCVGMLYNRPGYDAVYDGSGWTVHRALPRGYGNTIDDISCVGKGTCMVVDREGNAWRRTP
jgi:hypothetical protein